MTIYVPPGEIFVVRLLIQEYKGDNILIRPMILYETYKGFISQFSKTQKMNCIVNDFNVLI